MSETAAEALNVREKVALGTLWNTIWDVPPPLRQLRVPYFILRGDVGGPEAIWRWHRLIVDTDETDVAVSSLREAADASSVNARDIAGMSKTLLDVAEHGRSFIRNDATLHVVARGIKREAPQVVGIRRLGELQQAGWTPSRWIMSAARLSVNLEIFRDALSDLGTPAFDQLQGIETSEFAAFRTSRRPWSSTALPALSSR